MVYSLPRARDVFSHVIITMLLGIVLQSPLSCEVTKDLRAQITP